MLLQCLPPEKKPVAVGPQSWITREVLGTETQLVENLRARVHKGENVI